jgi:hypothetical protein
MVLRGFYLCWEFSSPDKSPYRTSAFKALRARFNSDLVVYGLSQSLFASKILFRGLNRDVAEQKLDLFQLAPGAVAETSTRPSKVMGREFYELEDSNQASGSGKWIP